MAKQASAQPRVQASGLDFLKALKENNNRDWFNTHKDTFLKEQELIEIFAESLLQALNTHDEIETLSGKKSLHRIYRDTRFSKDKTPYKTNWSGSFKRATRTRRGGYYFHIEPGNSFVSGGFWGPNTQDLKRIREELAFDAAPLRKILDSRAFKIAFGAFKGEQLKTAPQGFPNDHEAIDLLRYKQFLLFRPFTDKEVLSEGFFKEAVQAFKNMRPFFDYMSEILTTDTNGLEV